MVHLLDTVRMEFRGNYETLEAAVAATKRWRNNDYITDNPADMRDHETFSMVELNKLADQIIPDTSERIRADRSTLVDRLYTAWREQPLGTFRKKGGK